jgi:hypothetical protein
MSKARSTHVKKHVKGAKNSQQQLILKEEKNGEYKEYYATITREMGDCRFAFEEVNEGFVDVAKALKAIAKKFPMKIGDLILVQFDCETKKYFVKHKYTQDHIRELKKGGHLNRLNQNVSNVIVSGDIVFEEEEDDEPINIDDL